MRDEQLTFLQIDLIFSAKETCQELFKSGGSNGSSFLRNSYNEKIEKSKN
jgi:hypothetical protein